MPTKDQEMRVMRNHYVMKRDLSHAEYYRWLADHIDAPRDWIVRTIGPDNIRKSRDPAFNDIPLRHWDALHAVIDHNARYVHRVAWSLSDTVCVAKQIARDWLLSQHTPGETYRTPEEHGAVSARGRIYLDPDEVARGHDRPWLVFAHGDCITHAETLGVARKALERENLFVEVPACQS